jgi:hypothetical protein
MPLTFIYIDILFKPQQFWLYSIRKFLAYSHLLHLPHIFFLGINASRFAAIHAKAAVITALYRRSASTALS